MNSDNIVQSVQKGFHVTLGAASFLAETIQDPIKRDENMAKLGGDFNILSEEWAVEGEKKEQEARQLVETLLGQPNSGSQSSSGNASSSSKNTSGVSVSPTIAEDLKELTEELASIRQELEKTRES